MAELGKSDLTLEQADKLGSIFVISYSRGDAILFQNLKGGVLYTQVDTEEGPIYTPGVHTVNRTGVYAVLLDKNIERDFTLIARVPGLVELDDCEVVIHKASVSFPDKDGTNVTFMYDDKPEGKDEVDIVVLSTRFTSPEGGEELELD